MFHTSILEAWKDDKTVLGERIRNIGVIFQPMKRRSHLLEDDVQLCNLLWIGFPMISS